MLDVQQGLEPAETVFLQIGQRFVFRLVQPVCRHTGFGDMMHFMGSDLEFDRGAVRTDQTGMQGLVIVQFRDGDIVLYLARNRFVERMEYAKRHVALRKGVDDNAESVNIQNLGKRQILVAHFAINTVQGFFSSVYFCMNAVFFQRAADGIVHFSDQCPAIAA